MLVVIPTYRRLDCLRWTLLSLMQAELPATRNERYLVCIANNYPDSRDQTHVIIDEVRTQFTHLPWEWRFLDREETLPPVDNWYSAIQDIAQQDEVVFLQGDDDLFTPWSIVDRYIECLQSGADLLLTHSLSGLVYISSEECYFPEQFPVRKACNGSRALGWEEIVDWGSAFIGNHCYRNSGTFRAGIERAFIWCEEQFWLDRSTRTLMLPYYLPYAITIMGGQVRGFDSECVIRGRDLEEILHAPFGVSGWNSGFLTLCAYGVLNNTDLATNAELKSARFTLAKMASEWFFTFFVDKRIQNDVAKQTLQRIPLPKSTELRFLQLMSLRRVLVDRMGLTAWRLRRQAPKKSIPVSELFLRLMGSNKTEIIL